MQPTYWDVCTRRKDGLNTIYETVAENCGPEDARLIAAAPELLAACMSALRALEDNIQPGPMDEDAKTGLRAAIARATGNQ